MGGSWFRSVAGLACASGLALGCAFSHKTALPRSAIEQLLTSGAIDRALEQLDWPDVAGKVVRVQLGAPEEAFDRDYLRRSVEIEAAKRGGILAGAGDEAGYTLNVLVGALGVDESGRLFGVQGTEGGGLIPFTVPELALFKIGRLDGFAKLELALFEHRSGGVVYRSGPAMAATYQRSRTILFVFTRRWTDVTRFQRSEVSAEEAY